MSRGPYKKKKPPKERFEAKYRINPETGCWDWIAYTDCDGYGKFFLRGVKHYAHRVSYELYVGPIPEGLCVLHKCDNRKCVNPAHFFLGTKADNMSDKVAKNRQAKGSDNGQARLTELQVLGIRELHATGNYTQRYLAKMFGVSYQHISSLVNLQTWKHL